MVLRPLLIQRRLDPKAIRSRSLANLTFGATRTLRLKQGPCSGSTALVTPDLVSRRHFSVSFSRRSTVAEASTTASTTVTSSESTTTTKQQEQERDDVYSKLYVGPLEATFRRLKIFSLASLSLSTTLAPFIFVIESNLPPTARMALASIAITTPATSTAMVAWVGKPYVTALKYIRPEDNGGAEGMEMTTMSLFMKPRITTVYDPSFLVETRRAFAKWELAQKVCLPKEESQRLVTAGQEETIAETRDAEGKPLGRWVVTWDENGEGTCRELGTVFPAAGNVLLGNPCSPEDSALHRVPRFIVEITAFQQSEL
ncbi:hypothetical protein NP233_g3305 [Leucocoprinus birnbaumii]|uniref:Uncharacterized protein n=1 Tax=Leucocoprinus birnbaumii TaxID=56174 RepID=A0AAD5YY25_9AGAR|nr:hypothetical protein NP233_g3305 [Leucocoprinus birnbaumii]